MRHLVSTVVSLLIAPAVYLLTGVGLLYWADAGTGSAIDYTQFGYAAGALAAAAGLYSVLMLPRLSPLGPLLGGLLLLAVPLWALRYGTTFNDIVPNSILGIKGWGHSAAGPIMVLLAIPLILTVASPRRWSTATTTAAATEATEVDDPAAAVTWPPTADATVPMGRESVEDEATSTR